MDAHTQHTYAHTHTTNQESEINLIIGRKLVNILQGSSSQTFWFWDDFILLKIIDGIKEILFI